MMCNPSVWKTLTCVVIALTFSTCPQWVRAQSPDALDDITIRVIGLDEIPKTTMQVIELPEPDLGEINDIRESAARRRADVRRDAGELSGVDGAAPEAGSGASNGGNAGAAPPSTDSPQ